MREWICSVMEPLNREWKFIARQELVRCKDCKHCGYEIRDGIKFAKCELKHNWMPQADWFCADGEKAVKWE